MGAMEQAGMQNTVYKNRTNTPATAASRPPATLLTAPLVWLTDVADGTLPVAVALSPSVVDEAGSAALLAVSAAGEVAAAALALTSADELGYRWPASVVRLTLAHCWTKSL